MAKSGKHSCKQAGVFTPVGSSSRSSARENKAGDERTSDAPNETLVVPNQKPIITREKPRPGVPARLTSTALNPKKWSPASTVPHLSQSVCVLTLAEQLENLRLNSSFLPTTPRRPQTLWRDADPTQRPT